MRLSADFPVETLLATREWHDIFKAIKGKTCSQEYFTQQGSHSDLLESDGECKNFTDSQNLTEFSVIKPALQQMLKNL